MWIMEYGLLCVYSIYCVILRKLRKCLESRASIVKKKKRSNKDPPSTAEIADYYLFLAFANFQDC